MERRLESVEFRPSLCRKDVARRYNRDLATIDRWHQDGTLPDPIYMRGPMWSEAALRAAERRVKKLKRARGQSGH